MVQEHEEEDLEFGRSLVEEKRAECAFSVTWTKSR